MTFAGYLRLAREQWWVIVVVTLASLVLSVWASVTATAMYRATATVYVVLPVGSTVSELSQGSSYTQSQMDSYAELVTTSAVLDPVIRELDLDSTSAELAGQIDTAVSAGTVMMDITASSDDPEQAAAIASATADSLAVQAQALSPGNERVTPVELTVVEQPVVPATPYAPNKIRNVTAALMAGLLVGFALAILRASLDRRFRSADEVETTMGLPVLAEVPQDKNRRVSRVRQTPYAEAFRRIRASLDYLDVDRHPLVLVVTSPQAGDGKSTTVMDLAAACAEDGLRVLVIDGDLRRPTVHDYIGTSPEPGLSTVLAGKVSFSVAVSRQPRFAHLDVLTSGAIPPNPSTLLASVAMADLIREVSQSYDVVLIDSPPTLPVVDATLLGRVASGALLVMRMGKARRDQGPKALATLERSGTKVLGVVLNAVAKSPYRDSYYYHSRATPTATPEAPQPHLRVRV